MDDLDRKRYIACVTLEILDDLKQQGELAGGPIVNRTLLRKAIEEYELSGVDKPSNDEIIECALYFREGGQYENDMDMIDREIESKIRRN